LGSVDVKKDAEELLECTVGTSMVDDLDEGLVRACLLRGS